MKHIRLKILSIIWLSVLMIFATFVGVLSLIIPSHFEKEAETALRYEMEFIDKSMNEDTTDDEYVGTFLSGNICFIDYYDEGYEASAITKSTDTNSSAQNDENEIRERCDINKMTDGDIITIKTDRGYYVLTKYPDAFLDDGSYQSTILYINIQPVVNYTRSLNWILAAVFGAVIIVMSIIGYKLGKKIEEDHDANHKFFQNSSHELKTPLMAIQGYAEGIQQGIVDTPSSAEIIIHESEKMAHMIDGMLSISKIDAHQIVLHLTTSDLREILYDCIRTVEPIQQKKNIQLSPLFTDSPVSVKCDESQLSKVFVNVLINGIRHCRNTVIISCKVEDKDAVVKIKDDGNGIADEDFKHLFDRFYSGVNGNTGIGLALSREILNLHNGSIKAYNEIGAVFEIHLPLA